MIEIIDLNHVTLVVRDAMGRIGGSLTFLGYTQVIHCIVQRGVAYTATVLAIAGGVYTVSGSGAGYLSKPDGLDLLPATALVRTAAHKPALRTAARTPAPTVALHVARVGALPQAVSKLSAVARSRGSVILLWGIYSARA